MNLGGDKYLLGICYVLGDWDIMVSETDVAPPLLELSGNSIKAAGINSKNNQVNKIEKQKY